MKYFRSILLLFLLMLLLFAVSACNKDDDSMIEITLWHVYGGQTDSPLNDLIEEFNNTVGAENNIHVTVTSVTNSNTIHENVLAAAFGDPSAPGLPDMFCSYPKTVSAMPDDTLLVDYSDYFSDGELSEFIPEFVEEGIVNDRLVVLPLAKSTEVMFINKTAFDRFADATGADISELSTWEGLFAMAERYTEWTDEQTPDIPGDGKVFFVHDFHFNYFQVGVESLGEDFFDGDEIAYGPMFEYAWEPYCRAALNGSLWLQSGYATEPLRTGDAIVSVASSASVLYYSDIVTYNDNTTEQVEIVALPCPTFENGEKLVMQRGVGVCTVKSTPEREQACVTFLKWLTDAKRNTEFVTKAGYMPVKQEAFEKYLMPAIENLKDKMYISLYRAFLQTQKEYTFYFPPKIDTYLELETSFESNVRNALKYGKSRYMDADSGSIDVQIIETLNYFENCN